MERVRIPEETRRDFYLYVDEFQNFVTDAFAGILSEARKYRLNLTVAHQYTAQLISDKSSAVRDAVFGNVGTMIVFRVGSDDADFLEKEFDPEFTPGDIVNLPNYKVYLKLMIDGVTSRPFSAKTMPPLVKSGNKEIEQEVIQSSRNLYCKSKAVVEREINDWSGMSLGDDNAPAISGSLEKYPIICSLCGLEKTVPFKPEKGRPAYCKDCIARIKSGEVKVEKGSEHQIKHDETKFFKPLADLGIEFDRKDAGHIEEENRHPEKVDIHPDKNQHLINKPSMSGRPGILGTIKKVFTPSLVRDRIIAENKPKPTNGTRDNIALREVINKTLSAEPTPPAPKVVQPPAHVSLDSLKNKLKDIAFTSQPVRNATHNASGGDRSASPENMSKLKDLILEKTPSPIQATQTEPKEPLSVPVAPTPSQPSPMDGLRPKEVPEDVLMKILE
jgi:CxxC-x17-CxxC domain-containing protein